MNLRPLYLHVGCRKSGTSSLQGAFKRSREELLAQGLHLPFPSRPQSVRWVHQPVTALSSGSAEEGQAGLQALARRLREGPGDRLLITLEDLAETEQEQAARLVSVLSQDFEVHVVVTARDWSRQIPSEWQQSVKSRFTLPYADFVQAVRDGAPEAAQFLRRQHLPDIARRWGSELPPERIHVLAVPSPHRDPMGVFRLFGELVGVDADTLHIAKSSSNTSLDYEQAETLRRMNVALGDRLSNVRSEYRPVVRPLVINGALRKQTGEPLRLPAEHAAWCREASTAMLEELRAAGHDLRGDLADLVPSAQADEQLAEVSEDRVAEVAVQALADAVYVAALARAARPAAKRSRRRRGTKTPAARSPRRPTPRLRARAAAGVRRLQRRWRGRS